MLLPNEFGSDTNKWVVSNEQAENQRQRNGQGTSTFLLLVCMNFEGHRLHQADL